MNAVRVLRLYDVLFVVMAGGWVVNFYLGVSQSPVDWRGVAGIPLLVVLCATMLLRRPLRARIARGETEVAPVGAWPWVAAAFMIIIAAAALLIGVRLYS